MEFYNLIIFLLVERLIGKFIKVEKGDKHSLKQSKAYLKKNTK
jgi:hypothetical protein